MYADISSKITKYFEFMNNDKNHRYKSWEHCYNYFSNNDPNEDIEKACLHLSFYLASWGMYRGSSALLWKDYLVHKEVVEIIGANKHFQKLDFRDINDFRLDEILSLGQTIRFYYNKTKYVKEDIEKNIQASDTLVTKVLLGTLGCIPAFDRFFIGGLRQENIDYYGSIDKNFRTIVKYYKDNTPEFDKANTEIGLNYPAMKLVDMFFWQVGYEKYLKEKKKQ